MKTYNTIFFENQRRTLKTSVFNPRVADKNIDVFLYYTYLLEYIPLVKDLIKFLEVSEKERAYKYHKEIDKNRFIICRSLLKIALAHHTKSDISDISIELLPNNKPFLPTYPDTYFNITHSGDFAAIAISNRPIGIDIEFIDLNYDFKEILTSIFNKDEIKFINNSDYKSLSFYTLWTRKEAFVKALGKGIDDDFINIPCLNGLHNLNSKYNEFTQSWNAIDFQLDTNYLGSLVFAKTKDGDTNIQLYDFPKELLRFL